MLVMRVLGATFSAASLLIVFVGCDRPAATVHVKSATSRAKATLRPLSLPKVAAAVHDRRQAAPGTPTAFMSAAQLQAVEKMRINHVPEFGHNEQLTIVEESAEDRELREHQEAQRAEYAARVAPADNSAEVDDALEAMVRFYFRQALAGKQPTKVSLLIRGRRPSEIFLKRFAGEMVEFNQTKFPKNPYEWKQYEVYQWNMKGPDQASIWMSEQTGGSQQISGYVLVRREGKWQEPVYVDSLILCGVIQPVHVVKPQP